MSVPNAPPLLAPLLSPDRWLLWLGILFVLSVYYFPTGVVGRLRALGIGAVEEHRPGAQADDRGGHNDPVGHAQRCGLNRNARNGASVL